MAKTRVGLYQDRQRTLPWIVRWFGEFDPITNKPRRYSKSFRLKRDAEAFQAAKQAEFDEGGVRDRQASIELKAFCEKYMRRRRLEWREGTRLGVQHTADRLMAYFSAKTLVRSITADQAAEFFASMTRQKSTANAKPLSADFRNRVLREAKTMFRYAVEWGHCRSNPFAAVRQIRVGKGSRRSWHYVTPDEYLRLLEAAPSQRWRAFYALAYFGGLRFGELVSLTPNNVDLKRGMVRIEDRDETDTMPPFLVKDHEARSVPIPAHTVTEVRNWLKARPKGSPYLLITPERYERVSARWQKHREDGTPWLNTYLLNNTLREVRRHAKKAKLKLKGMLTMHCLRKSCAQNWANHLPMATVREFMGHGSIATTAEFYSTVSDEHVEKARWVMDMLTKSGASDAGVTLEANISDNLKVG